MTVKPATAGMKGFDCNAVLSAQNAADFKAAGMDFCLRYGPRHLDTFRYNLTNPEMLRILEAGLALMVVQHVAEDGWEPSGELGTQYGDYIAEYCEKTVGLSKLVSVCLDLEMVKSGTPVSDTINYCNNWWDSVNAAGYSPSLYVGYQPGISADELYRNLHFKSYFRAYNYDDGVSVRGFQMIQGIQKTLNGIPYDPDVIQADNLGGLPMLLYNS